MQPKRKAPVKAAKAATKAPPKPPTVAPTEKSANMSQEAWEEEKLRVSMVTADRRRRRLAALEAANAAAAHEVCLGLGGGQSKWSQQPTGRNFGGGFSSSPSSLGYYVEGLSLSQMRLSHMDGRVCYSPSAPTPS